MFLIFPFSFSLFISSLSLQFWQILLLVSLLTVTSCSTTPSPAPEAAAANAPLNELSRLIAAIETAVTAGDIPTAKLAYETYDATWYKLEDGVKTASKDAYKAIETGMEDVQNTLTRPETVDKAQALRAVQALQATVQKYKTP